MPEAPQAPAPGSVASRSHAAAGRDRRDRRRSSLVDQLTKFIVRADAAALREAASSFPDFLDVTHVQNTGAAFGLLQRRRLSVQVGGHDRDRRRSRWSPSRSTRRQLGLHERLSRYGLALILGGAFGNLIDRAVAGYVVDFVDVYWGDAHFWAFNVADAAITIGAVLVLLEMIGLGRRHASHPV